MRTTFLITVLAPIVLLAAEPDRQGSEFFERHIRPVLVKHCYECHSEGAREQQGGLLLDRRSGWLQGGDSGKAVVPGDPDASLIVKAIRYNHEDLRMPPEEKLAPEVVKLIEKWIRRGAPGPKVDLGETEFSRLGDQEYLFSLAKTHWAFQPIQRMEPPAATIETWKRWPIDRFVTAKLAEQNLTPSRMTDARTLFRRLSYDLTGLPPSAEAVKQFVADSDLDRASAIRSATEQLLESQAFGEHIGRMWLDVVRYADTDSFYRPDTKTPHYFPFAFTYRDYVVESFNEDKPFDQFIREQLAADLMGFDSNAPEMAALGFLTVGPHANRNPTEAMDDWIDTTTRGLMGVTAACARCHDHKYEPVPTADYYSLQGVFASIVRIKPLKEDQLPLMFGYEASESDRTDYEKKRADIDKKINGAGGKKAKNNNRSIAQKIRETELAQLLAFHPGAPVRTMVVLDKKRPVDPYIFVRGDAANRGDAVPRRFLKVLDHEQPAFEPTSSGRLELANKIVSPANPLTARVFVNRVWGQLMGNYLVATPSDFGLQGARPTHPKLLDWLTADFIDNGWSTKHLVRTIVASRTYQQRSEHREDMAAGDPINQFLWRANRKHLSIEAIRDSLLAVASQLDRTPRGRPSQLWGEDYTQRRAIYGFVNRFNLDPTLRVFDFPSPMQSQSARGESVVAPQALFTMNSKFVIDQAAALTKTDGFVAADSDEERVEQLFRQVFQRPAAPSEITRIKKFVELQDRFFVDVPEGRPFKSPWALVAQAMLMSNEFQYVD